MTIQARMRELQDRDYHSFISKLLPTLEPEIILGIRTPDLRKLAKAYRKEPESIAFLNDLPHQYYEENNLHALLIEELWDYDATIAALDMFLPYVDNWATCDALRPKIFKKNLDKLIVKIRHWLQSDHPYTVRFAIEMLMVFYLDEAFNPEYPALVAAVDSEEYYVKMMVSWYFATALAKQYDAALSYLTEHRLSQWIHNKTIQKAVESYRISAEKKETLRKLRIN